MSDSSSTKAPPTLLTLPAELLDRIVALALDPTNREEFGSEYGQSGSVEPQKTLMSRARNVIACKALLKVAIPAYFRNTEVNAVLGNTEWNRRAGTGRYVGHRPRILFGTFEEHTLFFNNTQRLRTEVYRDRLNDHFVGGMGGMHKDNVSEAVLEKALDVIRQCHKLAHLVVSVHGLDEGDGAKFYERAKQVVEKMMKTSKQRINVRKETKKEYETETGIWQTAMQSKWQALRERDEQLERNEMWVSDFTEGTRAHSRDADRRVLFG